MTYENYPWLDLDLWNEFVEHRKEIKKPLSERAERMGLNKLRKLTDQGHDMGELIEDAIFNGWQSFFPREKKSTDNFKGSTIDARPGETYEQYEARKRQVRH